MMSRLIHDAINKFNTINLKCGTLALELESESMLAEDPPQTRKRLEGLLEDAGGDLATSRQLLAEIIAISGQSLDFYKENEHFFKVIEPIISVIENKRAELGNIINENKSPLAARDIVGLLHVIEEKALACGIILKELRGSLIKAGKYKIQEG